MWRGRWVVIYKYPVYCSHRDCFGGPLRKTRSVAILSYNLLLVSRCPLGSIPCSRLPRRPPLRLRRWRASVLPRLVIRRSWFLLKNWLSARLLRCRLWSTLRSLIRWSQPMVWQTTRQKDSRLAVVSLCWAWNFVRGGRSLFQTT